MPSAPSPVSALWPDPTSGPWEVTIYWRAQHGVPTPVGVELKTWRGNWADTRLPRPTDNVEFPPVTGRLLRELPVGRLVETTLARWTQFLHPEWDPTLNPMEADLEGFMKLSPRMAELISESEPERQAVDGGRKHGRGLGSTHYERVAQVYKEAVRLGQSPVQSVAEAFQVSKSNAAKYVARAREQGFLPQTTRGRVGPIETEL